MPGFRRRCAYSPVPDLVDADLEEPVAELVAELVFAEAAPLDAFSMSAVNASLR